MPSCSKCQGAMEQGVIVDRGHYDIKAAAEWAEGVERRWYGNKATGETRSIETWRCTRWGLLESYTR